VGFVIKLRVDNTLVDNGVSGCHKAFWDADDGN